MTVNSSIKIATNLNPFLQYDKPNALAIFSLYRNRESPFSSSSTLSKIRFMLAMCPDDLSLLRDLTCHRSDFFMHLAGTISNKEFKNLSINCKNRSFLYAC
ncbi:hypothetical protein EUGRSUZ_G02556 [Eucalyptus grandis]|uniref:Uncharacterized protein n=2 Tax=Eucalyptus grandis TaxID=71139 RepID=A0ACC3K6N0_EUCGR|nr:hypothetical protein EUGRSUZ_G02556 [Eucalyptus grandis]